MTKRKVGPMERIAVAFERIAAVAEKWYEQNYPELKTDEEPGISKFGDTKPEPQTVEEYRDFPEGEEGRFTRLLKGSKS